MVLELQLNLLLVGGLEHILLPLVVVVRVLLIVTLLLLEEPVEQTLFLDQ